MKRAADDQKTMSVGGLAAKAIAVFWTLLATCLAMLAATPEEQACNILRAGMNQKDTGKWNQEVRACEFCHAVVQQKSFVTKTIWR